MRKVNTGRAKYKEISTQQKLFSGACPCFRELTEGVSGPGHFSSKSAKRLLLTEGVFGGTFFEFQK